ERLPSFAFWVRDGGPAPPGEPSYEAIARNVLEDVGRLRAQGFGPTDDGPQELMMVIKPAPPGEPCLTVDGPTGQRRMVICHASDPGAMWWEFDAREAHDQAAALRRTIAAVDAFLSSLRRAKGRPVEKAENAWIMGFATLVRDAAAKR